MASHNNHESDNNKFTKDRYDVYNSTFENPIESSDYNSNIIKKNISKFAEFCAFIKWMPDIYYDMITPTEGTKISIDVYQRVMMRLLSRFQQNYFCIPRGGSKTLLHIMVAYHTAICHPNITLAITSSTKESATKIWKEKHDEILRYYPSLANEIKSVNFSKDTGRVEFQNGAVIDNLANAQQSKGLRRRRGGLEEACLIDKDLYEDAIEPIFNIPRSTMTGEIDPTELNGAINRFSTSGYKNSDEYEKILTMLKEMVDLKGSFVFGSDWFIPVHFGRQKMSIINKARSGNIVRFRQNYLCDWIGATDGALINISKMIKSRILTTVELECPKDKKGNLELNEYVMAVDVARSSSDSNNKSAIVVLKIIRNQTGTIRQIQIVNIITPPNGLNYEEQSILVKRTFYKYGGNLDLTKSRVKACIIDANTIGQGLVEKLLEDVTDYETNEELGCWATINTDDKPKVSDAPLIVYALKSQGINGDIIRIFINYVESNVLKLVKPFEDIKGNLIKEDNELEIETICSQTQILIDEVANLKLKKTTNSITVEQVVKRVDKDRFSATVYGLYYISLFLEKEEEDSDYDFVFTSS
jgi:ribonucleoside-diphosphate reductase alpha chain